MLANQASGMATCGTAIPEDESSTYQCLAFIPLVDIYLLTGGTGCTGRKRHIHLL